MSIAIILTICSISYVVMGLFTMALMYYLSNGSINDEEVWIVCGIFWPLVLTYFIMVGILSMFVIMLQKMFG